MRSIKGYLDEWRVQEYLLITFFISWLSWGILILLTNLGVVTFLSIPGVILFVIGGFGPTISAIMCIEGKLSLRKLKDFVFKHRKGSLWYLLLFGVLETVVVVLSSMEINSAYTSASPLVACISVVLVFAIIVFFGGGNEELGWRGTLQPLIEQLMAKKIKNQVFSSAIATIVTGLIWALWHGPLWFVIGSAQQSIPFGLFVLNCIILSFWLTCIYRRTHSVFYCMLLHGLDNLLLSAFVVKINWILCVGFAAITISSILLIRGTKPVQKISEET